MQGGKRQAVRGSLERGKLRYGHSRSLRDRFQRLSGITPQPPYFLADSDFRGLRSLVLHNLGRVAFGCRSRPIAKVLADGGRIEPLFAPQPGDGLQPFDKREIVEPLARRRADRLDQFLGFPKPERRGGNARHPGGFGNLETDVIHGDRPCQRIVIAMRDKCDKPYCKSTEKM